MAIKKVDHFVLTSAQPERLAAFYETLGFTVKKGDSRYELFAGDFKINLHTKGNELEPHAHRVQTGSADFCLEVEGAIEPFIAELTRRGVNQQMEIVIRHGVHGRMKSVYLRDPDGNLLEFSSYAD